MSILCVFIILIYNLKNSQFKIVMLQIKNLIKNYKKQLLFLVVFIIFCGIYFFVDPSESSFFLKCPLKTMSGYDCAGCGVQRAFHGLLHLRIVKAFQYNPLYIISIPFLVLILFVNFSKNEILKARVNNYIFSKISIVLLLIVVFVFSLIRNFDCYKTMVESL